MHLRQQIYLLSQREPFSATHPVVVSHYNKWRLIERMWNDFRRRKCVTVRFDLSPTNEPEWYGRFRLWWNGWWGDNGDTTWHFKKQHCTLVGPPNAGKTTAARLISRDRRPFVPSSNRDFCLSGLCNEDYDYVLWDDFELNQCCRRTLLCLMQGDFVSIDVKCQPAYLLTWQKPIIFTTNFAILDQAFLARSIIIDCDIPLKFQ